MSGTKTETKRESRTETGLASWFASRVGGRLLDAQRRYLTPIVQRLHGDALLWLGPQVDLFTCTERCMAREYYFASEVPCARRFTMAGHARFSHVTANFAALPLPSKSVDNVVLHHALELSGDRQGTLREAMRVLRHGGRLVVVGFNPLSLWLLTKPALPFRHLSALSLPRLYEWFNVLGLEPERPFTHLGYRAALPLDSPRWQQLSERANALQLPFGGAYIAMATKVAVRGIRGEIADRSLTVLEPEVVPRPAVVGRRAAGRHIAGRHIDSRHIGCESRKTA